MANNNQKIAISILEAVGGKDNIAQVAHCMTRLRLNLKDESILNADEAKKIQGVLGVQKVGAQQQFIIGQNVPEVYMAFCEEAGIQAEAANDELIENKKPKGVKGLQVQY
ncbi:PTS transporter subunit EIIB [Candidatus Galacturonibacter soehngenii]|nr:PTS glucose/sucrose transporter subunit IIB [Candidatus Galacturonibacter soehngenii]